MKKFLAGAVLALGLVSSAHAQTVSAGTYNVEGTNLDGSAYKGTATIELTSEVDESIVGGLVLQVGNRVLDASIRNRLEKLRREVAQAA